MTGPRPIAPADASRMREVPKRKNTQLEEAALGVGEGGLNVLLGIPRFLLSTLQGLGSYTLEELRDPELRVMLRQQGIDPEALVHEMRQRRGRGEPLGPLETIGSVLKGAATMGYDLQRAAQGGPLWEMGPDGPRLVTDNPEMSTREKARAVTELGGNAALLAEGGSRASRARASARASTVLGRIVDEVGGPGARREGTAILPEEWSQTGQRLRIRGGRPTPVGNLNREVPAFLRERPARAKPAAAPSLDQAAITRNRPTSFREVTPEQFNESLQRFKTKRPDEAGFITWRTPEQMRAEGMQTFLNPEGNVGYGLHPATGDIRNLFNAGGPKGAGAYGVADAISRGGRILDAFDTKLTDIYRDMGFRETSRMPWDEQYRPEGWNAAKYGTPDVINMEYPGEGVSNPDVLYGRYRHARKARAASAPRAPDMTSPVTEATIRMQSGPFKGREFSAPVGKGHISAMQQAIDELRSSTYSAADVMRDAEDGFRNEAKQWLTRDQALDAGEQQGTISPERVAEARTDVSRGLVGAHSMDFPEARNAGEFQVPSPELLGENVPRTGSRVLSPHARLFDDAAWSNIFGPGPFSPAEGAPSLATLRDRFGPLEQRGSIIAPVEAGSILRVPQEAPWAAPEPARVRSFMNIRDAAARALEHPLVEQDVLRGSERGFQDWYNTDPIAKSAIDALGPEEGMKAFKRLMGYMRPTSIASSPEPNLRLAGYQYWRTGNPEAPRFAPGYKPLYPTMIEQKIRELEANQGAMNPVANPKLERYGQALEGNWAGLVGDRHFWRRLGHYGFEGNPKTAYGPVESAFADRMQQLADEGILQVPEGRSPTSAGQAAIWGGAGEATGVRNIENVQPTFYRIFEDAIHRSSRHAGVDPLDFLGRFWRRETPIF